MAAIELSSITKRHGQQQILNAITLSIQDGEFLTLLGPSGCGKSTLLRIIAGLDSKYDGAVNIDGKSVDDLRPRDRDVSMVFQSYALYPHLTARENISLPLKMRQLSVWQRVPGLRHLIRSTRNSMKEIDREVDRVAESLEIASLLHRKPSELSGGQRQRVALARAIVRRPRVFLMDEPLSNLDSKLRVQMRSEISELYHRLGTTFVYVTHDQAEAMTMSTRIAVMVGGKILQIGTPDIIYSNPQTAAVARYVGTPRINLLAAKISASGKIDIAGTEIPVRIRNSQGNNVLLGVRPEAVSIVSRSHPHSFAGRIRSIENMGSDLYLQIDVPGQKEVVIVREAADAHSDLRRDTVVYLAIDHTRLVAFDEKTEGRLIADVFTQSASGVRA